MASASDKLKVLIYGSHQFPKTSQRYEVVTVPKIWVNDKIYIDGAAPTRAMMEMTLIMMIEQAFDDSIPKGKFSLRK
jgi:hypothetical protein